jgi:hypothetical protein
VRDYRTRYYLAGARVPRRAYRLAGRAVPFRFRNVRAA